MRTFKSLWILLFVLVATPALADDPIETGIFNNYAIYGYDPVAYFTQNKAVKGSKKYSFGWRGAEWRFASQEHLDMFRGAPEKYAPQYGGYCAYAMSQDRLVGIDEDAFTIHEGKLYLNYSKGVMKDWRADKAAYIQKADAIYPTKVNLPE